jgi:hypothetical protein
MKLKILLISLLTSAFMLAQQAPSYYSNIDLLQQEIPWKASWQHWLQHTYTRSRMMISKHFTKSDADPDKSETFYWSMVLLILPTTAKNASAAEATAEAGTESMYTQNPKAPPILELPVPVLTDITETCWHLAEQRKRKPVLHWRRRCNSQAKPMADGIPETNGKEMWPEFLCICMYAMDSVSTEKYYFRPQYIFLRFSWRPPEMNIEDPVSAFEVQRNNVTASWQGNRNPLLTIHTLPP